jgi:hypothetical protein
MTLCTQCARGRDETCTSDIPALRRVQCALPAVSRVARAPTYPSKPITIIVRDHLRCRQIVAERMRRRSDNYHHRKRRRSGRSIGTGRAARVRSDGYAISIGTIGTNMLNRAFHSLQQNVLNYFVPSGYDLDDVKQPPNYNGLK